MTFIWRIFRKSRKTISYYLAERIKTKKGKWVNRIIRNATHEEIKEYHERRPIETSKTIMVCDYPFCDELIPVTREEKIIANTTDPQKGILKFNYCSSKCREQHLKALKGG